MLQRKFYIVFFKFHYSTDKLSYIKMLKSTIFQKIRFMFLLFGLHFILLPKWAKVRLNNSRMCQERPDEIS
jgi:hypothetical protein